jgi:hypothetical protein
MATQKCLTPIFGRNVYPINYLRALTGNKYPHPQGVPKPWQHAVAQVKSAVCEQWRERFSFRSVRRSGVDVKIQHVVAQLKFTVCQKRREDFSLSSGRPGKVFKAVISSGSD